MAQFTILQLCLKNGLARNKWQTNLIVNILTCKFDSDKYQPTQKAHEYADNVNVAFQATFVVYCCICIA